MNPRFQDGSFQTAADMLRNQQREFVEPLMQQLAANLGDILAGSTSCAVGQAVQAAQNRDVRPRREPDYGTSQHRLLLSMSSEVQTLLRRNHTEVESRMDKLFAQQEVAETDAELSRKRQMHLDLQSDKSQTLAMGEGIQACGHACRLRRTVYGQRRGRGVEEIESCACG